MKLLSKSLLGVALAMALNFDANAITITPATPTLLTFTSHSQSQITSRSTHISIPTPRWLTRRMWKVRRRVCSRHRTSTAFFNSVSDPEDATISYISGPKITAKEIYLLVKDGNHTPFAFSLTSQNGMGRKHSCLPTSGSAREPSRMCRYIREGSLKCLMEERP